MQKKNKKNIKIICLHLGAIGFIFSMFILLCFQYIFPKITKHGTFIIVPNLQGVHIDKVEEILKKYKLRPNSTFMEDYSDTLPPLTVLQQIPKAGTHVKENRTIYLTINKEDPPKVRMPKLIDGSVRNAQLLLNNRGLHLGNIQYVPDIAQYAVLEQWYKGKPIATNTLVPKGSKIDLIIGAGTGKNLFITLPNVVGSPYEEVKLSLLDIGIQVSAIHKEKEPNQPPGTILHQLPKAGSKLSIGETVELWIVGQK